MAKERISGNVPSELATQVRRTAKKAGLSVSAFIEKAVEGLLGHSDVLAENTRLSKDLDQRGDRINELCLEREKLKEVLRIAQQKARQEASELKVECDRLSRQITGIKSERDVIKAHRQSELRRIADVLGMEYIENPNGEYLAKLSDAICAKIEVLTESHDIYKAASEEKTDQLAASEAKVKVLLDRGWWARVWNRVPWASEKRMWDTPSRPITPTGE